MHGALLQELSWIPSSEEIHLEQIYRIRDWWGDVIQLVEKHWQNNTTDTHSWCRWFHQVAGVQCWQPYNTLLDCKESSSASRTEETRNNRDRVYHSLGLCWKLSLCGAGWNLGISLEQGLVYHASCGDIFQEWWCASSHLTAHNLWSVTWLLFCSWTELQRIVTLYIKENLPQIKRANYFIDSCAGHYKNYNYKAFLNLCHHKSDFGIDATWVFVATSHWKSPCDRIDSTVKCKKLCASLQRPVNNQILTFLAIKEYCKSSI